MQFSKFVVDEDAFCVWDTDIQRQNLDFLRGFDADFFRYVATTHLETLASSEHQAAQALRLFYGQALETMFALIFAGVQAPDCVLGWLQRYQPRHLKILINKVDGAQPILNKLMPASAITWDTLAHVIHSGISSDEEKKDQIEEAFSSFLRFAARQYLDQLNTVEYNSIKHGLRASSGGFVLRIGIQQELDAPPPADQVQTVAAGRYGSSFYSLEPLTGISRHYGVKSHSTNWDARSIAAIIKICGAVLNNTLSTLKVIAGEDTQGLSFWIPNELSNLDQLMRGAPGSERFYSGPTVAGSPPSSFTKEDIIASYDQYQS
jgi:hypothetical protein